MEGTHTPSPFEVLWDRYRSLVLTVVAAVFLALVGNYAWKKYEQGATDQKWSTFLANLEIDKAYADPAAAGTSSAKALEDVDLATIEQRMDGADSVQKPYYLLAIARKAMMDANWDRAESALSELESGFPEHVLVKTSKSPLQTRDVVKPDEDEKTKPDDIEWVDAKEGSVVSLMREQIANARGFEKPASFTKPEIPADAPKVKFTFGDYGSFTIALMPQAPLHKAEFLKLAAEQWWNEVAVDEIHRSTENREAPYGLHFGFASTKDTDRTKWTVTEPSEHQVEFENTGLSHFPGAVAGREGEDGKSCVDRLWISVDDEAALDGNRVVFGYVVEGLDVLRTICEAGMSAQEEQRGQGRPEDSIRVTAVEVL